MLLIGCRQDGLAVVWNILWLTGALGSTLRSAAVIDHVNMQPCHGHCLISSTSWSIQNNKVSFRRGDRLPIIPRHIKLWPRLSLATLHRGMDPFNFKATQSFHDSVVTQCGCPGLESVSRQLKCNPPSVLEQADYCKGNVIERINDCSGTYWWTRITSSIIYCHLSSQSTTQNFDHGLIIGKSPMMCMTICSLAITSQPACWNLINSCSLSWSSRLMLIYHYVYIFCNY